MGGRKEKERKQSIETHMINKGELKCTGEAERRKEHKQSAKKQILCEYLEAEMINTRIKGRKLSLAKANIK